MLSFLKICFKHIVEVITMKILSMINLSMIRGKQYKFSNVELSIVFHVV